MGRLLPAAGPAEGPIRLPDAELKPKSATERRTVVIGYLRADSKLGLVNCRNLLVQVGIGLELVQRTSFRCGMAVPNNLFALAATRLLLCCFFFARLFFGFGTKDIRARAREVAKGSNNVRTCKPSCQYA
jgi:hypothetical protein